MPKLHPDNELYQEILSKRDPEKMISKFEALINGKNSIAELNQISKVLEQFITNTKSEISQLDIDIIKLKDEQARQAEIDLKLKNARVKENPLTWLNQSKKEIDQTLSPQEIERQIFAQQGFGGPEDDIRDKENEKNEKTQLIMNAQHLKTPMANLINARKTELYQQMLENALKGDTKAHQNWVGSLQELDGTQRALAIKTLNHAILDNPEDGNAYFLKAQFYSKHYHSTSHKESYEQIISLLEKASSLGSAGAASELASCYKLGARGLEKDPEKALDYYQIAKSLDNNYANPELDAQLKARMESNLETPAKLLNALAIFYDKVKELPEYKESEQLRDEVDALYNKAQVMCDEALNNTQYTPEEFKKVVGEEIVKLANKTLSPQTKSDKVLKLFANIVLIPLNFISSSAAENLANSMTFQMTKNRYQKILGEIIAANPKDDDESDNSNSISPSS